MKRILIFAILLLPFLAVCQTITIIGINDRNTKITRFENSTIDVEKCNMYNHFNTTENIENSGLEIVQKSKKDNVVYYLINTEHKVGMLMIGKQSDICRTTSWYDGIELKELILSKL